MFLDPGRPLRPRPLRSAHVAPHRKNGKAPSFSKISRLDIAWLSVRRLRITVSVTLHRQGWLPGAGQALLHGLSTRRVPTKGFQLTSCLSSPFSGFLTQFAPSCKSPTGKIWPPPATRSRGGLSLAVNLVAFGTSSCRQRHARFRTKLVAKSHTRDAQQVAINYCMVLDVAFHLANGR